MKTYKMIRSQEQKSRCTNKSTCGSPLYCTCGCQSPIDSDSTLENALVDIIVSGRAPHGYADYILTRNGIIIGELNTQYSALLIDGREYLGCEGIEELLNSAWAINDIREISTNAGEMIEETAAIISNAEKFELSEQDDQNKNHFGYCNKCHTYCYGDCEAN